ncbi:urease accessory protein UreD [Oerskovia flava]|uniref:urease accessory protein UreD n=1 Tax=Oerskovia flava TaxID=2986422 RepID=UPI00223F5E9C|nr:urease accessory protein UreD [Oerskovia sp. JB1-3-2]
MEVTRVASHGTPGGRVRCTLEPAALSPRVLRTGQASAQVALIATRALLLGGDDVRLEVRVGAGTVLELVEISGTVAYHGRGRAASWTVDVHVEAGGRLVWDALPFVVAEGADVERRTHVHLEPGAVALLRETLVLGRTGESGGRLRTTTRADLQVEHTGPPAGPGAPSTHELFVEDLDLGAQRSLPGILGTGRVLDTVLLLGARPAPDEAPGPLRLDLAGPGALARHLGPSTHDARTQGVFARWAAGTRAVPAPPAAPSPTRPTTRPTTPLVTARPSTTGA